MFSSDSPNNTELYAKVLDTQMSMHHFDSVDNQYCAHPNCRDFWPCPPYLRAIQTAQIILNAKPA